MEFRDDIRNLLAAQDRRQGHARLEVLFPVSKIIAWFKKQHQKPSKTVWVYDGCACTPQNGARSVPYCEKHFNPMTRKELP